MELIWNRTNIPKAEQPLGRRYHSAVIHGTDMYVYGGTGGGKVGLADFYSLNLSNMKWNNLQNNKDNNSSDAVNPQPCFGHIAFIHGDEMVIHGGTHDGFNALNENFMSYNLKNNTWHKIGSETGPTPRFFHSAVQHENNIYIFGGCKTNKIYYNDFYKFELETSKWTNISVKDASSVPKARAGHVTFVIDNTLFLYGGFCDDGGYTYLNDMYMLRLDSLEKWEHVELLNEQTCPPTGRTLNCCVTANKKAYIFGGYDGKHASNAMYCFSPKLGEWQKVALWLAFSEGEDVSPAAISSKSIDPNARYGHSMVLGADGVITVFGGSGSSYLSDVFQIETTT